MPGCELSCPSTYGAELASKGHGSDIPAAELARRMSQARRCRRASRVYAAPAWEQSSRIIAAAVGPSPAAGLRYEGCLPLAVAAGQRICVVGILFKVASRCRLHANCSLRLD